MHACFSGAVQGVGFRFTARSFAHQLGLKGVARNLSNGNVEVIAFGSKEDLKELLRKLKEAFPSAHLKESDLSFKKSSQIFDSFDVF